MENSAQHDTIKNKLYLTRQVEVGRMLMLCWYSYDISRVYTTSLPRPTFGLDFCSVNALWPCPRNLGPSEQVFQISRTRPGRSAFTLQKSSPKVGQA